MQPTELIICSYQKEFEKSWVYCRSLAYTFSQFQDQITSFKETYPLEEFGYEGTIEIVALHNNEVIGLMDVGIFNNERNEFYPYVKENLKGAYIECLAVHPDHQRKGIAKELFQHMINELKQHSLDYLAIFTRNDQNANSLYKKLGAKLVAKNYRVLGELKNSSSSISSFKVNFDEQRLDVYNEQGKRVPFVRDFPEAFIVYREEDLDLFEVEELITEHSYILRLNKLSNPSI